MPSLQKKFYSELETVSLDTNLDAPTSSKTREKKASKKLVSSRNLEEKITTNNLIPDSENHKDTSNLNPSNTMNEKTRKIFADHLAKRLFINTNKESDDLSDYKTCFSNIPSTGQSNTSLSKTNQHKQTTKRKIDAPDDGPYCKRKKRNTRERERVLNQKNILNRLIKIIPPIEKGRFSKIKVLKRTKQYILYLKGLLGEEQEYQEESPMINSTNITSPLKKQKNTPDSITDLNKDKPVLPTIVSTLPTIEEDSY